jgi:hypothetical protein
MNDKILGFKLEESGRSIFAGFNECSMTLIFTKNPDGRERDLEVSLSGLNLESDESAEWLNKEIKVGDEFVVQVKESVPISPYRVKEKSLPYQEVLEKMSEEEKLEMKLRQFKYLEKKLKFKGLI